MNTLTCLPSAQDLQSLARIFGGVPIWGVLPGSAAHRAGVRYGDIVVRVNGIETTNVMEFVRAHHTHLNRVRFEVLRQGTRIELAVELSDTFDEESSGSEFRA